MRWIFCLVFLMFFTHGVWCKDNGCTTYRRWFGLECVPETKKEEVQIPKEGNKNIISYSSLKIMRPFSPMLRV